MSALIHWFVSGKTMLQRERWRPVIMGGIVLLIGTVALFTVSSPYGQHLLVLTSIFTMLTASFNLIVGYTGYLTLAHGTFFGLGGYASVLLMTRLGVPYVVAFFLAPAVVGIIALAVGAIALKRVSGFAFAIVTLGFAITTQVVVLNWISLTRGPFGIPGVPRPTFPLPGGELLVVRTNFQYLIITVLLLAVQIIILEALTASRIGRSMIAIRENQPLASAYGVNPFLYKLLAFVISAVLAAMTGAFNAHFVTFIAPDVLAFFWIVTPLVMLIVGGSGHKIGTLVAAVVLTLIPELLRMGQELRQLLYGITLLLFILLLPGGLGRLIDGLIQKLRVLVSEQS